MIMIIPSIYQDSINIARFGAFSVDACAIENTSGGGLSHEFFSHRLPRKEAAVSKDPTDIGQVPAFHHRISRPMVIFSLIVSAARSVLGM